MEMTRVRRRWLLRVILGDLILITLVGCGGVKHVPIAGSVTLDGKPVSGIILTFAPDASKGNTASISCFGLVTEGRYELHSSGVTRSDSHSGVPLGWYKVMVRVPKEGGSKKKPQAQVEIPSKYLSVDKTPLEVEVKDNPEPGAYDFKLTK